MQSPDAVPAWTRDNSRTIKDFFTARDDSPDNGPRRASLARMPKPYSQLALLRDPRLAPHVMSPVPAWLWALEPPRILWRNGRLHPATHTQTKCNGLPLACRARKHRASSGCAASPRESAVECCAPAP